MLLVSYPVFFFSILIKLINTGTGSNNVNLLNRNDVVEHGMAFGLAGAVQFFTWGIHFWFTRVLSSQIPGSLRGPWPVLAAWFLSLLGAALECHHDIMASRGFESPQAVLWIRTNFFRIRIHKLFFCGFGYGFLD
jgi:hypothetical protein